MFNKIIEFGTEFNGESISRCCYFAFGMINFAIVLVLRDVRIMWLLPIWTALFFVFCVFFSICKIARLRENGDMKAANGMTFFLSLVSVAMVYSLSELFSWTSEIVSVYIG